MEKSGGGDQPEETGAAATVRTDVLVISGCVRGFWLCVFV